MSGSGSHYYTHDGILVDKVLYKDKKKAANGETRATTVTDARERDLRPSVTTFLTVAAKPQVEIWKIGQAVAATMKEPYGLSDKSPEDYMKYMVKKADEYADMAAEFGTQVHNAVCNLLGGRRYLTPTPYIGVNRIAEHTAAWIQERYDVVESEHTFVNNDMGFAGTIDIKVRRRNGTLVRIDIKTNDFTSERECPFYFEHQVQLAGYHIGDNGTDDDETEVLYVSRQTPGLIVPKLVVSPTKAKRAFMAAAHHWAVTKDWTLPEGFYNKMFELEGIR